MNRKYIQSNGLQFAANRQDKHLPTQDIIAGGRLHKALGLSPGTSPSHNVEI